MVDKKGNFINFGFLVVFIFLIILGVLGTYGSYYDCIDKADKLNVEVEWSINMFGFEHCIYTLENGKKISAEDYKYVIIELLED